jgi:HEAT repeat protein
LADILVELATTRSDLFPSSLKRAATAYPSETASACIRYIAEWGIDPVSKQMLAWLRTDAYYLEVLLDPQYVSDEDASSAMLLLQQEDPQFFTKLFELPAHRETLTEDLLLRRALNLLGSFNNLPAFVRWLQRLTRHKDERIRSKAVKWLCAVRPDKEVVQRYFQSDDGRVRANTVEALWGHVNEEAEAVFRHALEDKEHRTVANAIVGLHRINRDLAVEMLAKFVDHSSSAFRLAMVWAISHIGDGRCMELLRQLAQDHAPEIREKAQHALSNFQEKQFD